jgi:HK97 family phage major capsid protein/HK97 family phage prohead protease
MINEPVVVHVDPEGAKVVQRLADLAKKPQQREASVGAVDVEARTVELSFSSDAEYRRYWGIEVLGHQAGEVRMGRLTDKAAVLWNHNWDDQRGVVESARIDADGKGRAVIRLSKSEAGEQLLQDIADGIITKVSVGYMIHGLKLAEERDDVDVYRVTDWEPFEISLVSVPADNSVGVGRAMENPPEEQPAEPAETNTVIRNEPPEQVTIRTIDNMSDTATATPANNQAERQAGADAERNRANAILDLAERYAGSITNARELASQHVKENKSVDDFQRTLLAAFDQRTAAPLSEQGRDAELGMDQKELRRYSFMNVARALANPQDAAAQRAAAFELECSVEAQKKLGRTAQGILVPPDVLARAAMSTTQSGAGATMVETDVMRGSFIDLLRNKCVMMGLATNLGGLVGNIDIPKKNSDGQAYWIGEGQDAQETGFTLGQISMSPKTIAAFTDITRRLMLQTSGDAEAMVRFDLLNAMAQGIDKAALYGTGGDFQPKGLKLQSGINAVAFAQSNKPTYAELVQMETEVAADNADIGSLAYLSHARFRGYCKTALKFASAGSATIWEPGNTVNGYRTEITNQVTGNDVFYGNFADFVIAMWAGLDLTVDKAALAKSGGTRLIAFQDVDMGLRRVESICIGG